METLHNNTYTNTHTNTYTYANVTKNWKKDFNNQRSVKIEQFSIALTF